MIPLVIVSIVISTAPFWAVILAWCLINEKITSVQGVAMILSFIGIALVSSSNTTECLEDCTDDRSLQVIGVLCVLVTAWCTAGDSVFIRKLQDVPFAVILFYYGIMGFIVSLLLLLGKKVVSGEALTIFTYSEDQLQITLLSTINAFFAQIC